MNCIPIGETEFWNDLDEHVKDQMLEWLLNTFTAYLNEIKKVMEDNPTVNPSLIIEMSNELIKKGITGKGDFDY